MFRTPFARKNEWIHRRFGFESDSDARNEIKNMNSIDIQTMRMTMVVAAAMPEWMTKP